MSTYDIIGDIHGRSDELKELLDELGYEQIDGIYQHPEGRQAIFIGDFINKGPDSRGVIDIVRPMVESGHAQAILGNHEFSAIVISMLQGIDGMSLPQNGFLDDYEFGSDEYNDVVDWFKTLPVYLDLEDFRVVHACWDDEAVDVLDRYLEEDHSLGKRAIEAYQDEDREFLNALRALIIGPFYKLDDEMLYEDFNGRTTQYARILWWASPQAPIEEQIDLQGKPLEPDWQKKLEMREKLKMDFMKSSKPTFIGHYYLPGPAYELSVDVTGVDFRDQVTAYRWNGAGAGTQNEFVEISAKPL